jgi:hypothetical protein
MIETDLYIVCAVDEVLVADEAVSGGVDRAALLARRLLVMQRHVLN